VNSRTHHCVWTNIFRVDTATEHNTIKVVNKRGEVHLKFPNWPTSFPATPVWGSTHPFLDPPVHPLSAVGTTTLQDNNVTGWTVYFVPSDAHDPRMVSSACLAVFIFVKGPPARLSNPVRERRLLLVVEYSKISTPALKDCDLKDYIVPHLSEYVLLCWFERNCTPGTGDKVVYLTHDQSVGLYGAAAPFGAFDIPDHGTNVHSQKALWVVQGRPRHYSGARQPLVRVTARTEPLFRHVLAYVTHAWRDSFLTLEGVDSVADLFCALLSNVFPAEALELLDKDKDLDALDVQVFRELVQRMRLSIYNRLSTDFSLDDTQPSGLVWLPKTDSTLNLLHWAAVHNEPRLIPRTLLPHLSPFTIDQMYGRATAVNQTAVTRVKTFHPTMYTKALCFDPLQYAAQFDAVDVIPLLLEWIQVDSATINVVNRTIERAAYLAFYHDRPKETRAPSALTLAIVATNVKSMKLLAEDVARFDTRCLTFRDASEKSVRKYAVHDGYDALLARICAVASYIRAREILERSAANEKSNIAPQGVDGDLRRAHAIACALGEILDGHVDDDERLLEQKEVTLKRHLGPFASLHWLQWFEAVFGFILFAIACATIWVAKATAPLAWTAFGISCARCLFAFARKMFLMRFYGWSHFDEIIETPLRTGRLGLTHFASVFLTVLAILIPPVLWISVAVGQQDDWSREDQSFAKNFVFVAEYLYTMAVVLYCLLPVQLVALFRVFTNSHVLVLILMGLTLIFALWASLILALGDAHVGPFLRLLSGALELDDEDRGSLFRRGGYGLPTWLLFAFGATVVWASVFRAAVYDSFNVKQAERTWIRYCRGRYCLLHLGFCTKLDETRMITKEFEFMSAHAEDASRVWLIRPSAQKQFPPSA
jgi:hypothetical protein